MRFVRDGKLQARPGFNYWIDLSRPLSRGHVRLTSDNPSAAPSIVFNHFQHPEDIDDLVRGVELVRHITRQGALSTVIRGELLPGDV